MAVAGGVWRQPAAGGHQLGEDEEEDLDAAAVPSDVELALISIRCVCMWHATVRLGCGVHAGYHFRH